MDEFFRCVHGRPISSPSVRMECKLCFEMARREAVRLYWRVRYKIDGMVW